MTKISDINKTRLINGFPTSLRQDVEEAIKIIPADNYVLLTDGQVHYIEDLIHQTEKKVLLDKEVLIIHYRNYFNEPQLENENRLTRQQKVILNCIYLRHHNGFVRQRRLEKLLNTTDYFVIPYTFQLLGEYVMEILEVLNKHVKETNIDSYVKFIDENKKYWQQTESRMISYWNEYYRRPKFPKLKDYIGKQIVDRIKRTPNKSIAASGADTAQHRQ